jgi:hypothetical protein
MRETGPRGVEKKYCDRVKAAGGRAYKFKSPARKNVPDRLTLMGLDAAERILLDELPMWTLQARADLARRIVAAAVHFAECKASGKKPNGGQRREINRLRKMGYKVLVVDE